MGYPPVLLTRLTYGGPPPLCKGPDGGDEGAMRADARRNYERIVRAASEAVARDGAEASLEAIARAAGVGSATLHRHFPSRWSLLQAVFTDRVRGLCDRAEELRTAPGPLEALRTWLREVAVYSTTTRGLAASILSAPPEESEGCS